MNTGIYLILNTKTNDLYIGSAAGRTGFKRRFESHKNKLRKGKSECLKLQNSWNKYGEEVFVFKIIEYCEPIDCIKREQYFIDSLTPSLNILKIAGSRLGTKQTKETKEKISNSLRGCNVWNKGIPMSDEQKMKISKTNTGKKHLVATKEKMSSSKIGSNNPNAKKIICIETREIFKTITEATKHITNVRGKKAHASLISACCLMKGSNKKAYGLQWRYL